MSKFRRYLPITGTIFIILVLEGVARFPESWAWWLAAIVIGVSTVGILLTNFDRVPQGWWHTLLAPLLLCSSALFLMLFVSTDLTRHLLSLTGGALSLFLWENLWRFYWRSEIYHNEALENASLALNTTTIWLTVTLFFDLLLDPSVLPSFLATNVLALSTLAILLMVIGIDLGTIWVQRYSKEKVLLWLVATALIISEVFWVSNFLPHRVEVKTFLVVLAYYLLTHLGRGHLDGTLNAKISRRYAYLASLTIFSVLVTARWLV